MRKIIAPNIHSRLVAVLCFAVGLVGYTLYGLGDEQPARFLVHPVVFIPFVVTQPEEIRDISQYEYGGIVEDCGFSKDLVSCLSLREQARNFILANWKAKRKSYIVLNYHCVDCFTRSKIFVEPDRNGKWLIATWDAPQRFGPPAEYTAVTIKRKRTTADDWGFRGYKKGERPLIFVDSNGETVSKF